MVKDFTRQPASSPASSAADMDAIAAQRASETSLVNNALQQENARLKSELDALKSIRRPADGQTGPLAARSARVRALAEDVATALAQLPSSPERDQAIARFREAAFWAAAALELA